MVATVAREDIRTFTESFYELCIVYYYYLYIVYIVYYYVLLCIIISRVL